MTVEVQDLIWGHGIVLDSATFDEPCLGWVDDGVSHLLDSGRNDFGEDLSIAVQESNRSPVFEVGFLSFFFEDKGEKRSREGGGKRAFLKRLVEHGSEGRGENMGEGFVEFEGEAIGA